MWTPTQSAPAKIVTAIAARYPILYLLSWEEERIEQVLQTVSRSHYGDERPIVLWTAARGFYTGDTGTDDLQDPEAALDYIASAPDDAIYLLKDLPAYFADNKALVRRLRDLYRRLADRNTFVVLSHPVPHIPEALKKEIFLIEFALPTQQEIFDYLTQAADKAAVAGSMTESYLFRCATAMRGLSLDEVRHVFLRLVHEGKVDADEALEQIYDEKAQVLLKESCLQVVPHSSDLEQIGGLENLKEWVMARGPLFSKKAYDAGIPMPSGVLFMGVSGCGKSLAAKVIATAWDLQLVRLDMNLVLSGAYGTPEYAFDRATRVVESIAPAVLWIDEVENSFGYDDSSSAGGNVNIFSSFLTWMQEKPASVFVAATANRIRKVPAEMIRKGRFDQVFFLDLPTEPERSEIFRIHIDLNGADPAQFDLQVLALVTTGWTGAEIEQAVRAARVDAFAEGRTFTQRDITRNTAHMVPLSKTMHEQVKELRDWSYNRATPASRKPIA